MGWASGAFTRIYGSTGWTDDKNAGTKIVSTRHDTHDQDIGDGINACLTRDGQSKPAADFLPSTDNTYNLGNGSFRWATLNAISVSDFARLSQLNTFTLAQTSGAPTSAIYLSSTAPAIGLNDTNSTANTRLFDIIVNADQLHFRAQKDDVSIVNDYLTISALNGVPTVANLQATSVQANSLPVHAGTFGIKTTTTTRASGTTLTNDPDLQVTLAAGTYVVELFAPFWATTSGAGGFKFGIFYSGTSSSSSFSYSGVLNAAAITQLTTAVSSSYTFATITTSGSAANADFLVAHGVIVTTSSGVLGFQWAQNSSNVNPANVGIGWLRTTKV